jgi:hypothetical protein
VSHATDWNGQEETQTSLPKQTPDFLDHVAFLSELAGVYRAHGFRTRLHPRLRGGKHSDLAVKYNGSWVYFEVKTRYNSVVPIRERSTAGLLDLQREIRRAARHAVQQLPSKRISMILVRTSPILAKRKPLFYRMIAQQALTPFFAEAPRSLSAVLVLMPVRQRSKSRRIPRFVVTAVHNPRNADDDTPWAFHQILSRYFGTALLSSKSHASRHHTPIHPPSRKVPRA